MGILTMKQEKTIPRGVELFSGVRTGVHRNTKMYMQLSNNDYNKLSKLKCFSNVTSISCMHTAQSVNSIIFQLRFIEK